MFHPILGDLFLNGLALMAVLLIVVLRLCGWAEKKRERDLQLWRARAKEQYQKARQEIGPDADREQLASPAPAFPDRPLNPRFRILRWEFLLAALAAVAVLMPIRMKVKARGPAPKPAGAVMSPETPAARQADPVGSEFALSLQHTNVPAASGAPLSLDPGQISLWGKQSSQPGCRRISFSEVPRESGAALTLPAGSDPQIITIIPGKGSQLAVPSEGLGRLR